MQRFKHFLFDENPVLVQLIGFCSVLAVSSSVTGAIGMALSFSAVLIMSNVFISLLRKFIPDEIRIPAFIVVIASFVTILQMVLQAYFPAIYDALGIFLPLIVVNCIILGRAEAYASKHGVFDSFLDGVANGLGYGFVITVVAVIRELLGNGTILGARIIPEEWVIPFLQRPASSFMLLGIFVMVINMMTTRQKAREAETPAVSDATQPVEAE
ncbi:MAG: electron transport complex subunit RsxE [Peptoniphilaceae bacterium]|nr:electron transport complex subunit RsxE [Peptoniphilaceae bacterium]MDY6085267.1 electron transport complex subunit RsxE [Peptoniphilaceae bacterium]